MDRMKQNIKRAILRRIKKWTDMKSEFISMKKMKKYSSIEYIDFLKIKNDFFKRTIHNWYKWCRVCECLHPYTKEVFWTNWLNKDWTIRLYSVCLKARNQIKKNLIIMGWEKHKTMLNSRRKTREKHKNHREKKKIKDLTEEEKNIQRKKWREYSKKQYHLKKIRDGK